MYLVINKVAISQASVLDYYSLLHFTPKFIDYSVISETELRSIYSICQKDYEAINISIENDSSITIISGNISLMPTEKKIPNAASLKLTMELAPNYIWSIFITAVTEKALICANNTRQLIRVVTFDRLQNAFILNNLKYSSTSKVGAGSLTFEYPSEKFVQTEYGEFNGTWCQIDGNRVTFYMSQLTYLNDAEKNIKFYAPPMKSVIPRIIEDYSSKILGYLAGYYMYAVQVEADTPKLPRSVKSLVNVAKAHSVQSEDFILFVKTNYTELQSISSIQMFLLGINEYFKYGRREIARGSVTTEPVFVALSQEKLILQLYYSYMEGWEC